MDTNSVNLMQYAVGGASLFILIAVGIIALFIKRMEARKEEEGSQTGKKEKESPLQKVSNKQEISPPQRMEQPKEVAPKQHVEEQQERQQRQIMQRLRENQQRHVRQAMASPQVEQESQIPVSQPIEPSQPARQSQPIKAKQIVNEIATLEIAFYKVQTTGRGENRAFFLDEYLNVGRNVDTNDWVIDDDPTVSSNHCRIYQKDGVLYILDLNSTNGTYVNEERVVGEMKLENHDKIRMGQSAYRIRI